MSQSVAGIVSLRPRVHTSRQVRECVEVLSLAGVILGGLVLLMAIHKPVLAQEMDEGIDRISVPYNPEDLRNPARQQHLLVRIDKAVLKVCGDMDGISIPMKEIVERSDCRRDSFVQAVTSLHNLSLTKMADRIDSWIGPTEQEP